MIHSIPRSHNADKIADVEQACAADRAWFDANPGENEYIREFVPGEFGAAELPSIPPGFRYATHVSVMVRDASGAAVGRSRRLMAVCEGRPPNGKQPETGI